MTYKLFIDDERFPVTQDWIIVRSSAQAIAYIKTHGFPQYIAFDHDLGGDDTSIAVIKWLIDELIEGRLQVPDDFNYSIHSQNPVGAKNIQMWLDQILRNF